MKANELADFILDTYEDIQTMDNDLVPHALEGGMHRLMLEHMDEWNMYKVYCMWTSKDIKDPEATREYIRITDTIQEGIDEKSRLYKEVNYYRTSNTSS